MKTSFAVLVTAAAAATLLVFAPSCGVLGGPPGNVQLQADSTGTGVTVFWTAPAEGLPDSYMLYFQPMGGTEQLMVDTTATAFTHDPQGVTGTYRIVANFGEDSYEARDKPSTVPVYTDTVVVSELNAGGESGYGWDRATGLASTYDVTEGGSASGVDFYVTDTRPGQGTLPYTVFSPSAESLDQGAIGVIPAADWHESGFTDHLSSEDGPLPAISLQEYFNYTSITPVPFVCGWYSVADDVYGMIKVVEVDADAGTVRLVTWFQLVAGLRLIMH